LVLSTPIAPGIDGKFEIIDTFLPLGKITAEDIFAPHSLPKFPRSSVDEIEVLRPVAVVDIVFLAGKDVKEGSNLR
jgi:hypothetical protein